MLPGRKDGEGRLYVNTTPVPDLASTFQGGIVVSPLAQVYTTTGTSTNFANGMMVADTGQLCATAGPISGYMNGLPIDAAGRIVIQTDAAVSPNDSFVGGLRVGAAGLHVSVAVPPAVVGPVNTVPPSISGGNTAGSVLRLDIGTWIGLAISYGFQWKRGVTNVGNNTNSYVVQAADAGSTITCEVTAVGFLGGSTTVASNGIAIP
jgi:hypothetical protein